MSSIGAYLRRERELRQVSLEELVQITRVPLKMLQHIESDQLDELPGDVFARGFVRSYARALGLDAGEVLAKFDRKIDLTAPPPPISSIEAPERGRRFGIAIALVILVLLFTLALSIVLN
ncbi:MAG TPA: helix-turn-helix domain-containing protein, partial [Polyangiaceae bacterium]|nr:helix-turn-helix domain-containing protein [Polyangiaceae bacterium]